jgi:hypothetical protein
MHRVGRERRAAGKERWEETVAISAYIHDQYSDDPTLNSWHIMRNVADLITSRLGRFLDIDSPNWDLDFADMIEDMRERSLESLSNEEDAKSAVSNYLSEIYDFFDYNNIWAGLGEEKIVKMISSDDGPQISR